MSTNGRSTNDRRKSILESLQQRSSGGFTTYAAELMAAPLGGTASVCTITHYCRTSVFELPGCNLNSDDPVPNQEICIRNGFRAAFVSDIKSYLREGGSQFPHYAIDVSLRDGVDRVYREELKRLKPPKVPIFLAVEQYESIPATTLDNGECFVVDECRDGKSIIEGGRDGKRALLAIRTCDGAWPEFSPDMHAVNTILAAVKVEQNVTHHIKELYSCSCFVSGDGRAVYSLHPTMNIAYGGVRVSSPIDVKGLGERAVRVRTLHDGLRRDSATIPQIAEIIDSVLLDKTQDDGHYRLWYLRLWQAVAEAKRVLGAATFEHDPAVIAGKLPAKNLTDYRNRIAHWWTGRVDFSFITGIQLTVLELLRRKYGKGRLP